MKLSIIISYRNRIDKLKMFCDLISGLLNNDLECILVAQERPSKEVESLCRASKIKAYFINSFPDDVFNTSVCHNVAVNMAQGEWILKNDIDCLIYKSFYNELIEYLEKEKPNYLIIGVKYFNKENINVNLLTKSFILSTRELDNDWNCGNEYVVKRNDYLAIKENENMKGYFGEDYLFLYQIYKKYGGELQFKNNIPYYKQVKENIVKPANKYISDKKGFCFLHTKHERNRIGLNDYINSNIKLLETEIKKLQNSEVIV